MIVVITYVIVDVKRSQNDNVLNYQALQKQKTEQLWKYERKKSKIGLIREKNRLLLLLDYALRLLRRR